MHAIAWTVESDHSRFVLCYGKFVRLVTLGPETELKAALNYDTCAL